MPLLRRRMPMLMLLCVLATALRAQDSSAYQELYHLPDKFFSRLSSKSKSIEEKLTKQTGKYLAKLAKAERKLQRALWKKDSIAVKQLFGSAPNIEVHPKSKLSGVDVYSGRLDSMQTVLRFLGDSKLLNQSPLTQEKVSSALNSYQSLQEKLYQAQEHKKYLKKREQVLTEQLEKFGLAKELKKFQKTAYYYRAQVDEYKRVVSNPTKLQNKLLDVASKIPSFKSFFAKHSQIAGLFRVPESYGSVASLQGLQTRSSIQAVLQQRIATGGAGAQQMVQQSIADAQGQLQQLKQKLLRDGSEGGVPDFKPNHQRTKSFFERLEFGTNLQTQKAKYYFPVTSDLGLSVGYKLNNRSIVGIGASYKLGLGSAWSRIKFTHEGIGLRSFIDIKLKGSFYASGGFEYNHQKPFQSFQQLQRFDSWQQSGLLGISKIVSIKSPVFKKTKVQLLWDVLSYRQIPRSQPIKFRIGYSIK